MAVQVLKLQNFALHFIVQHCIFSSTKVSLHTPSQRKRCWVWHTIFYWFKRISLHIYKLMTGSNCDLQHFNTVQVARTERSCDSTGNFWGQLSQSSLQAEPCSQHTENGQVSVTEHFQMWCTKICSSTDSLILIIQKTWMVMLGNIRSGMKGYTAGMDIEQGPWR